METRCVERTPFLQSFFSLTERPNVNQMFGKIKLFQMRLFRRFGLRCAAVRCAGCPGQNGEVRPAVKGKISRVPASELIWQMPEGVNAFYNSIDGPRLHHYVEEQAAISLKYRDAGNQWWGRIAGMPSGAETQAWIEQKFKEIDVPTETKMTPDPQDLPSHGKLAWQRMARPLSSKAPNRSSISPFMPSSQGDEELDTVWVGFGQVSDFIGKDVRGKAVFIYSIPTPS